MIKNIRRWVSHYRVANWAIADQMIVSGANFLTTIMIARFLGLEEFGRFSLAWMIVMFATGIQHAFVISPMMSIGPKQSNAETHCYYGAVLIQQLFFSIMTFFLLFLGVGLGDVIFPQWQISDIAFPLALAAFTVQFQEFLRRYFFTRGRGQAAFINDFIRYIGQSVTLLWLLFAFGREIDTAKILWVYSIFAALATICGAFVFERIEIRSAIIYQTALRHWKFSKWLTASAILIWTSGNFFIIAAGTLLGVSAVGALRAAQTIIGVTHILFQGLENIVPVRASEILHKRGPRELHSYLAGVALFLGSVTFVIVLVLSIEPGFWLSWVYGESFARYGDLLRWYAVIYILVALSFPVRAGLRALEFTRPIFFAYSVSTIFSFISAYMLIEMLGLMGVMIGILVSQIIVFSIIWYALRKRILNNDTKHNLVI